MRPDWQKTIEFRNQYLPKDMITARQFNAIRYDLDGNIRSVLETNKLRIELAARPLTLIGSKTVRLPYSDMEYFTIVLGTV